MNADKVIEVLERELDVLDNLSKTDEECVLEEALTQAISLIKENEELRNENERLKKAVASEGLGVDGEDSKTSGNNNFSVSQG